MRLLVPMLLTAAAWQHAPPWESDPFDLEPAVLDLVVEGPGLLRVPAESLPWTGPIEAAAVAAGVREGPIAIHVEDGDADGFFEAGDALELFVEGPRTRYSRSRTIRITRLAPGDPSIRRMVTVPPPDPAATPSAAAFPSRVGFEERRTYTLVAHNGDEDNFFWRILSRPNPFSTPFDLPGHAGGAARLALDLQGLTSDPADPDHHVRVALNGTVVADLFFDGKTAQNPAFDVPAGVLTTAGNVLSLSLPADTAAPWDYVLLDAFAVEHLHDLSLTGPLSLSVAPAAVLEIGPAAGPGSRTILDVTDPRAPRRQTVTLLPDGSGGWRGKASFDGPGDRSLYVPVTALAAAEIRPASGNALLSDSRGADLLVVTAPELEAAARRLANAREDEGLRARVVRTDEVYGAFSGGELSPWAIRDLVAHALAQWEPPAPRYLLLFGDGTYDFRGDLPNGELPTNRTRVPVALFEGDLVEAPGDDLLADMDGDRVPELAVGRIPAASAAEAEAFVDKLLAYAARPFGVGFETRALFVADDWVEEWERFYFEEMSTSLAGELPPWMESRSLFVEELGASATRAAILEEVNAGTLWVNYLGHGSLQAWGQEQFFRVADLASLVNTDRPAFFTALTCANGAFHHPNIGPTGNDQRSLAEHALFAPGGAIGFWGESLNGYPDALPSIGRAALRAALDAAPGERIGDALLAAKRAADPGVVGVEDLLAGMTFFGDPSMTLRANHRPRAVAAAPQVPLRTGEWSPPFDGTDSFDPDGHAIGYRWSIQSAPPGSAARVADASRATARLHPDLPGDYVLALEVSDPLDATSRVEVSAIAVGAAQEIPDVGGSGCAIAGRRTTPAVALLFAAALAAVLRKRRATTP